MPTMIKAVLVALSLALLAGDAPADTPTTGGGMRRDCTTNQILKWSGTTWICSALPSSSGTVTTVSTVAPLQGGPITTTGSISLQSCVTTGHLYKWNGTAFACAADDTGLSGLTTNRILKAASATTATDSLLSDNGTTLTYNSTAMQLGNTGNLTVGGSMSASTYILGGNQVYSYGGDTFLLAGSLGFWDNTNSDQTGYINDKGYLEGTTRWRSLGIRNGKSGDILLFEAPTSHLYYYGSAPTLTGCNAQCTMRSDATDERGTITCTDSSGSACTVTYANAYTTNAPVCWVHGTGTAYPYFTTAPSTTAFSFFRSASDTGTQTFTFGCDGVL